MLISTFGGAARKVVVCVGNEWKFVKDAFQRRWDVEESPSLYRRRALRVFVFVCARMSILDVIVWHCLPLHRWLKHTYGTRSERTSSTFRDLRSVNVVRAHPTMRLHVNPALPLFRVCCSKSRCRKSKRVGLQQKQIYTTACIAFD